MTTEEYIQSGILEIYASGGLSEGEQAEVISMAHRYPPVREELERIEAVLESYAILHAITPPAALKDKILQNLNNPATTSKTVGETPGKVINFTAATPPQSRHFNWLAAAAVILLLLSGALNYYLYSNWQKAEGTLKLALNQQSELAGNFKQAQFDLKRSGLALQVLENSGTKHVILNGLPKAPEAKAMIHWDPLTKVVLLEVKSLPEAPAGRQYQLWALHNGQPINAGLFSPADTLMGMQVMQNIPNAEAFAMTLEPTGGSANPTMAEMYLMGKM